MENEQTYQRSLSSNSRARRNKHRFSFFATLFGFHLICTRLLHNSLNALFARRMYDTSLAYSELYTVGGHLVGGWIIKITVTPRPLSVLGSEFHTLLFLSLIAKPHTHHVFLEIQFLGNRRYFLTRRSRLDGEIRFERSLLGCRNRRPLPLLFAQRKDAGGVWIATLVLRLGLGFLQPRLQDRLQRNHVVVG